MSTSRSVRRDMNIQLSKRHCAQKALSSDTAFVPYYHSIFRTVSSATRTQCDVRFMVHRHYRRKRIRMCATAPEEDDDMYKLGDDVSEELNDNIPVELADAFLDEIKSKPKLDLEVNEYLMLIKLRRMLHEDDFKRIFDSTQRRIGDI